MITGSCGHEFTQDEGMGNHIAVGDYDRDMSKMIRYMTVCDKCAQEYADIILHTKQEEDDWMNSK